MSHRHSAALAIQEGACNPSGIAHAIINACREIREEPTFAGTTSIKNDPAVRLMVHQLAYICGVTTGAEPMARGDTWEQCMEYCRKQEKETT